MTSLSLVTLTTVKLTSVSQRRFFAERPHPDLKRDRRSVAQVEAADSLIAVQSTCDEQIQGARRSRYRRPGSI
jgi:hypothetical protein